MCHWCWMNGAGWVSWGESVWPSGMFRVDAGHSFIPCASRPEPRSCYQVCTHACTHTRARCPPHKKRSGVKCRSNVTKVNRRTAWICMFTCVLYESNQTQDLVTRPTMCQLVSVETALLESTEARPQGRSQGALTCREETSSTRRWK